MADLFVLVHAPVLGPASWAQVAAELARLGRLAVAPSLAGFADGGPPFTPRQVRLVASQLPERVDRAVLVVHSGAGVLAPYLADKVAARQVVVVFADAAIPPGPGADGRPTVVDAGFLPTLAGLATNGIVPPWPRWWPEEAMAELVPDVQVRRLVLGEARSLPIEYFEEVLPPLPASWSSCRPCYLRFSEGYTGLAREAAGRGWPVRELAGDHLHMLVDPAGVAAAIADLAAHVEAQAEEL